MSNNEIFNPKSQTVKEVFGNANSFYSMPIYQRPYAWDKERVEQLWYDIVEAYKNNLDNRDTDKNYFLGSLVVIDKGNNQDVVDGQQRLTTLSILFCTIRDYCDIDNTEILEKTKINTIKNSIQDLVGGNQRLKLTTHSNNQAEFQINIIDGINFDKKFNKSNKFLQNAHYFKILIEESQKVDSEYYIENFNDFIEYLFNKTTMIKIVCYNENFAIKLFSVLNDRGLNLTPADIIKAHLMEPMVDNNTDLNAFNEVWKQIENISEESKENIESILNLYLYYLIASNPKKSLQDELKQVFVKDKDVDSNGKALNIRLFAEKYKELFNQKEYYLYALRYLPHSIYWKSILTTAKLTEYKDYDKLLSILTKYFYQSWIAGGTSNRIKQTSFKILRMIKNNDSIDSIKNIIINNLNDYKGYKEFLSGSIYGEKWAKPLLLLIEYFRYSKDENYGRDFIKLDRSLHIEHILPQSWDAEKSWDGEYLNWKNYFSSDQASSLLNTLGNLTLLTGSKNIEASNCNFNKKQEIYGGNSHKGFDGKIGFEITKEIIENEKYKNEWNIDTINLRYSNLINEISEILDIK